jgi:hypothetical protein
MNPYRLPPEASLEPSPVFVASLPTSIGVLIGLTLVALWTMLYTYFQVQP